VSSNYGTIPDGEVVKFYDGTILLASVPLASETREIYHFKPLG
jgi:hypothetical protein